MSHDPHQGGLSAQGSGEATPLPSLPPLTSQVPPREDELAHPLSAWLNLPTAREQRRYLESHYEQLGLRDEITRPDLLAQGSEASAYSQREREQTARVLLQDVQRRGGTVNAICAAYINRYGGFVLDLPPWLEVVEQRLQALTHERWEETADARIALLQEAQERVEKDGTFRQELVTTLRFELADAWYRHQQDRHRALETTIDICEGLLQTSLGTEYPYQYALVHNLLGNAYGERHAGERRENLERSIACLQEALRIWTFEAYPFDYAKVQNNLSATYADRIEGERRENLERSIVGLQETLRVQTREAFPFQYATTQSNLAFIYIQRIAGERRENLERALTCLQKALCVLTPEAHPFAYGIVQDLLGFASAERLTGERRENLEKSIAYRQQALRVWTLEAFPFYYAMTQHNLGQTYLSRIEGSPRENQEQAISHFQQALRVWTLETFPFHYAGSQESLGQVYTRRLEGSPQENQEQAIAHFQQALQVYTVEALPREARAIHVTLAETEAQRGHWDTAERAYRTALEAEDLLVILGAGTPGRDAILKEGHDAAIRQGYVLSRLGNIPEAAVAMERGRARGLAEAMALDAADPFLISDEERRTRYGTARATLLMAQAHLHALASQDLDEDTRRHQSLECIAAYRQAKAAFDHCIAEIRAAQDPAHFLGTSLNAATIVRAAERSGSGHAVVYLAATPWGGIAVAARSGRPQDSSRPRFVALDLPDLTETWVNALIETRLSDGSGRYIGGFALAQMGEGFEQLQRQWEGPTFQAKAKALHAVCRMQKSTMDAAAQETLKCRPLRQMVKQPLSSLTGRERNYLCATFDHLVLKLELAHCLKQLGTIVIAPLLTWLREQGATSLTLIPCGHLATFPLASVLLPDGRALGEILPTSIAPNARALLSQTPLRHPDAGIYALGDPECNLKWSEAEALTLTALARRLALPAQAHVKEQATREQLLAALNTCWMVDASCHATFDSQEFLRSALRLAQNGRIRMSELISHQADLRGLRLLLLSACQTALLDLQGARDEMHSLAAAMLQAGAQAVLASQWAVDDKATYLLVVRFAQEWFPQREQEPPAAALARAQAWLRRTTNEELATWQSMMPTFPRRNPFPKGAGRQQRQRTTTTRAPRRRWEYLPVRTGGIRYEKEDAQLAVRIEAEENDPSACPYADPYYWAGFQVIGW